MIPALLRAVRRAVTAVVVLGSVAPAMAHHGSARGGCLSEEPALLVTPQRGDGYVHLANRYLRPEVRWTALRAANGGRPVQVGRAVAIPLSMLPDELQIDTLRLLFPEDGYRDGAWQHVVGQKGASRCREDSERLASWFAEDRELAGDLRLLNDLPPGRLPAGMTVRIPREMLRAAWVPADAVDEPSLAYGEDDAGAYALYRLQPGEALYSSVVIRFTGHLDADEVNEIAREIAKRSGIQDVRKIPIGFPIKIPRSLLLARHLPAGDPERQAWEREQTEVAQHRVQARARRLAGVHVILDAGHGGIDVGTTQKGMDEDEYVYDVMCRVKRRLERETDAMVLTTIEDKVTGFDVRDQERLPRDRNEQVRTTPPYVPIDPDRRAVGVNLRWYLANSFYRRLVQRGVDPEKVVFLSLHADSLHPTVSGAMAYIPGENYRQGRYGSGAAEYASFEEVREKIFVSFDRPSRLHTEGLSRQFAEALFSSLKAGGIPVHRYEPIRDHVIRQRRSWVPAVIRCSEIPVSVLVELVNLSNAGDRERMRDPGFREKLASAFVDALQAFYEGTPSAPALASSVTTSAP